MASVFLHYLLHLSHIVIFILYTVIKSYSEEAAILVCFNKFLSASVTLPLWWTLSHFLMILIDIFSAYCKWLIVGNAKYALFASLQIFSFLIECSALVCSSSGLLLAAAATAVSPQGSLKLHNFTHWQSQIAVKEKHVWKVFTSACTLI